MRTGTAMGRRRRRRSIFTYVAITAGRSSGSGAQIISTASSGNSLHTVSANTYDSAAGGVKLEEGPAELDEGVLRGAVSMAARAAPCGASAALEVSPTGGEEERGLECPEERSAESAWSGERGEAALAGLTELDEAEESAETVLAAAYAVPSRPRSFCAKRHAESSGGDD